jgi:hypothetical protein
MMNDAESPIERPVPDEVEAQGPRMTLMDLLVLTACAAAGLALGRWLIGEELSQRRTVEASTVLFGMVFPGLIGALILGHPVILLLHAATGRRRQVPMRLGEIIGLVPGTSLALLAVVLFASVAIRRWGVDAAFLGKIAIGAVILCILANAITTLVGVANLGSYYDDRLCPRWTDVLGTSAALLPAAMALTLFMSALIYL